MRTWKTLEGVVGQPLTDKQENGWGLPSDTRRNKITLVSMEIDFSYSFPSSQQFDCEI